MKETMYITRESTCACNSLFAIHWGRQEWVDGSGQYWMTFLIYSILDSDINTHYAEKI